MIEEYECEVLTPLFLGGANSRQNPELRSPSIRGSLRFWYRALIGGTNLVETDSEDELKALRSIEGNLFGTSEKGSTIAVSVTSHGDPAVETFQKDRAIRTLAGDYLPSGKDYLLWSMASAGQPGNPRYLPSRQYIVPGTRFTLKLRCRINKNNAQKAGAALWLLSNLGALGARANRGAGSIQTHKVPSAQDTPNFKVCQSVSELESHLQIGINQCRAVLENGAAQWRAFKENEKPSYDILSPDRVEIWIVANAMEGWNTYWDALNGLGEKLCDYRSHLNPLGRADHDAVLAWLEQGGEGPEIKRAVFGLPIPFRYSGGGPSDVIQSQISDRRASPLHIRVTRLTTGKYIGVLTLFKSQFLEEGKQLQLQSRRNWKAPPPPNYDVVEGFFQTFTMKRRIAL